MLRYLLIIIVLMISYSLNSQSSSKPKANFDTYTIESNSRVALNVLFNDKISDIINANISIETPPSNGIAFVTPENVIKFRPNKNYYGRDKFVYEICDNSSGSMSFCDTAHVSIIIINNNKEIAQEEKSTDSRLINNTTPSQLLRLDKTEQVQTKKESTTKLVAQKVEVSNKPIEVKTPTFNNKLRRIKPSVSSDNSDYHSRTNPYTENSPGYYALQVATSKTPIQSIDAYRGLDNLKVLHDESGYHIVAGNFDDPKKVEYYRNRVIASYPNAIIIKVVNNQRVLL